MKFIVMGFLMSFVAAAGCMSMSDSAPAPGDEPQQSEEQSETVQPLAQRCTMIMGTCETGSFCRRVGLNFGPVDCPSGLICCV